MNEKFEKSHNPKSTQFEYTCQHLVFVGLTPRSRKKKGNARRQRALKRMGERMIREAFRASEVEFPVNIVIRPDWESKSTKVLGGIWELNWTMVSWECKLLTFFGGET